MLTLQLLRRHLPVQMKRPQRPRPPGRQSSRATHAPRSPLARCATAESTRRPPGARKGRPAQCQLGSRAAPSCLLVHRRAATQRPPIWSRLQPLALTPCRRRREIAHSGLRANSGAWTPSGRPTVRLRPPPHMLPAGRGDQSRRVA